MLVERSVESGTVHAEPGRDACLGDSLVHELAGMVDLVGLEQFRASPILAGRLGDADPLGLAFADQVALELCNRTEDLQHEPAHRVVVGGEVSLPFFDEVDADALGEDLVDELLKIDQ